MADEMRVRRALLSVYDRTGLLELGRGLREMGVEILATEGTARALRDEGIEARPIAEITGLPAILGGRVKMLHPTVFGGVLARRDVPADLRELEERGIPAVDLVAVVFYPFEQTLESGASEAELVEKIDVGGPSLLRAAAKNAAHVAALSDPADYAAVLEEMRRGEGSLSGETRRSLARKAFARTARYDAAIARWLSGPEPFPEELILPLRRISPLRYGENPHQRAALYAPCGPPAGVAGAEKLQGKEISYNNLLDVTAALALVAELQAGQKRCAAAVIKHGNPCGAAVGESPLAALEAALATDPVSAFGGVIVLSREVDAAAAARIASGFYEVLAAPGFAPEALDALAAKKNLRVLRSPLPDPSAAGVEGRTIPGAWLFQERDSRDLDEREMRLVTKRAPSDADWTAMRLAWKVVKHVRSNSIVFAATDRTLGIGAGQMSRVDAARLAVMKARQAGLSLRGSVVASDGFFPFRDGVDTAAEAGATAIIQPGGSLRDAEVIAAADERGLAMVLAGLRHFRH